MVVEERIDSDHQSITMLIKGSKVEKKGEKEEKKGRRKNRGRGERSF